MTILHAECKLVQVQMLRFASFSQNDGAQFLILLYIVLQFDTKTVNTFFR